MKNKKLIISLIVGLGVSGVAMYFSFRQIPFEPLMQYIASVNYWWMLPAMIPGALSFFARTLRWRILMHSVARMRFWEAFHPMMVGFGLNCILPGRVGEFARPAILRQKKNVPFFQTLATVAAERAFDLIVLLGLFVIVTGFVQIDPNMKMSFGGYEVTGQVLQSVASATLRLALVLLAGIILVSITATRKFMERVILASPGALFFLNLKTREKIKKTVCTRIVGIIQGIAQGFETIKSPGKLILCLLLSIIVWVLSAGTYWVIAKGCPGISLSFFELMAVTVIVCFFISLPSAPGFWGLWEAGGIFAMVIFAVPEKEAAGFTLVSHVVQIMPVIFVGLISAVITGVSIKQISSVKDDELEKVPVKDS